LILLIYFDEFILKIECIYIIFRRSTRVFPTLRFMNVQMKVREPYERLFKSYMIKIFHEITRNNLYKFRKFERSPQKPFRISCQSVLITRKIPGTFKRILAKNP